MGVERSAAAQGFLDEFPREKKSTVANKFLFTVRSGIKDPRIVVDATRRRLSPQFDGWLIDKMDFNPSGALSFAAWAVAYEAQPYEERQVQKETKAEQYREEFMKTKPPSERQLAYLKALGYTGSPPETMEDASLFIEKHKRLRT